jgi:hypothetical protein
MPEERARALAQAEAYLGYDDIGWFLLGASGIGAAVMAVPASLAALRAGLPGWLGWLGVALGVLSLGTVAFLGMFAWMAWFAIASIVMLVVRPKTDRPGMEGAPRGITWGASAAVQAR